MTNIRTETDSFGALSVPSDKYWGAQTQRSLMNFPIGWECQPRAIIRALGIIKQACATVNRDLGAVAPRPSPMLLSPPRPKSPITNWTTISLWLCGKRALARNPI